MCEESGQDCHYFRDSPGQILWWCGCSDEHLGRDAAGSRESAAAATAAVVRERSRHYGDPDGAHRQHRAAGAAAGPDHRADAAAPSTAARCTASAAAHHRVHREKRKSRHATPAGLAHSLVCNNSVPFEVLIGRTNPFSIV